MDLINYAKKDAIIIELVFQYNLSVPPVTPHWRNNGEMFEMLISSK